MHEDRLLQAGARFELGQQAVDVVDVLSALDLRHHDDVELVADLGDQGDEVVEHPRGVEAVDAGPQLGLAEVGLLRDVDEATAGGILVLGLDGVLEVAEDDVDLGRDVGHLGRHLLVARVEEVDHAARPERDVRGRRRGSDGQRTQESTGVSHEASIPG